MNPLVQKLYDNCPVFLQNCILTGFSAILDKERYGGAFRKYERLLEQTQWFAASEIMEYQNERLREVISHAYGTVPYYREVFDQRKLRPSDIRTVEDLQKLPLLSKQTIKARFNDLVSRAFKPSQIKKGHTSGTTGSPLEVCYDRPTIYFTYAALDRHYKWAGCRLSRGGDRIAVARGNVIVPLSQKKPPFWRHNYLHSQLLMSSFHLSGENLPLYFEELERFRPAVLDGYPSTLYIFAKFLKNQGRKFPLKAVISSSETLYDFQRSTIEESFQCRVFDYYAMAERVIFASECDRHEGHHLNMEYGVSEVVGADDQVLGKDCHGRLVGTGLHNMVMPLIRYVTNDMTSIRKALCACGRGLELMDEIATKAEDTFTLRDGRLISPSVLTHPFKPMHSIEESQVIQKDYDHIIIKLVPKPNYSESEGDHLIREFKARLGDDVRIEIQLVEELPRTKNGKFRWVISEIPFGI